MDQLEGELIDTGSPARNSVHEIRKGAARREAAIDSRFHAVDLKKIEFPVPRSAWHSTWPAANRSKR